MGIISRKAMRLFWEYRPASKPALTRWFKVLKHSEFGNFAELRKTFPNADKVGNLIVFNLGDNNYRLIASVHFNRGRLYIRHILTHREYDKGDWKK